MDSNAKLAEEKLRRLRRRFGKLPEVVSKVEEAQSHFDSKQFLTAAACLESIDDLDVKLDEKHRVAVITCISELQLLAGEVDHEVNQFAKACGLSTPEEIAAVVAAETDQTFNRVARFICFGVGSGFALGGISLFRSLLAGKLIGTSWYLLAGSFLVTGLVVAAVGMFGSAKIVSRILDSI